ncbi:MAG TPA: metallophosphoesterase [Solirubrobacterales bacterium]|nr:metallophosphoesterase [Solirubrobacterales bacterium]
MRTAIVSDLHLGVASDEDVLRDPAVRRILFEEIAGADRLVLLGDAVELRTLPLGQSLERARPFFEELGAALGDVEVLLVPGNHDHRLAEPLLDELSIAGEELGLEQLHSPTSGPAAMLDSWLGPARLRVAYPGVWLREDVYATHGHYMDAHLRLPRAECIATATMIRLSRPVPLNAVPRDYERVLRPIYGFAFGLAQALRLPRRRGGNRFERWWEILSGEAEELSLRARAGKAAFPPGIAGLNRLLHSEFEPDVSVEAISRSGVAAGLELATRLGLGGASVITGHTHRGGPLPGEGDWELPGGGRLHNTGSWVFSSAFHQPGTPPNSYWPGTVTWLEDEAPPRRVRLLHGHTHADLIELVNGRR